MKNTATSYTKDYDADFPNQGPLVYINVKTGDGLIITIDREMLRGIFLDVVSEFPDDFLFKQNSGIIREDLQCSGVDGNPVWWELEPKLDRVADGVAHRLDRLKAIGNGQVPAVAHEAFNTLTERSGVS